MNIKELPESERPYEKLELYGEKNLTNAELLAIIIKTGTKDETSVDIARKILNLNDDYDKQNFKRIKHRRNDKNKRNRKNKSNTIKSSM